MGHVLSSYKKSTSFLDKVIDGALTQSPFSDYMLSAPAAAASSSSAPSPGSVAPLLPCCRRNRVDVAMSSPLKLVVFVGSCRTGRMAERLKRYVVGQLDKRGHQVTVIDPEDQPELLTVRKPLHFHGPGETPPEWLSRLHEHVLAAQGYVVLCPEYNRCIAPALGSAMDHFPPDSYRHKPCAIVAYTIGTTGTLRISPR
ncbi:hypothetical protein HPB48_008442 [Haemaphysalis longicornis]|uniref:NADPH-dependent FMN reductase-like domain-containing protein n=1 Tax=Haemaphysalis longicornis TaxID=44386 RepID=A0A9J6H1N1_HAELO|nr:hypothetical protein HPB48_008442 [Haemaphysalis longicornis]